VYLAAARNGPRLSNAFGVPVHSFAAQDGFWHQRHNSHARRGSLTLTDADNALRVGLIGCGRLAERGYVPALKLARGVALAALADPVRSRCDGLAPAIPSHASAAALFEAEDVDAVVLATPASAHLADARTAAEAGVPALVEKPPAADLAETLALGRLDPVPRIGFNRRFEPWLHAMQQRLSRSSALELALEMHYPGDSWGSYVVRDDLLLAVGPHLLDLTRWLSGREIRGLRASALGPSHIELELELDQGRAMLSAASGRAFRDSVTVTAGGRAIARWRGHTLLGRGRRFLGRRGTPTTLVKSLVSQLEAFAVAVRGRPADPLATMGDAVAVMAAIGAARESAAVGGRWRSLEAHIL
jgi:predicted dehydrogenase